MKSMSRLWFLLPSALVALAPWVLWLAWRLYKSGGHGDLIAVLMVILYYVFCLPGLMFEETGLSTKVAVLSSAFNFFIVLSLCLLTRTGKRRV
jgi:hypothetical protein